MMSDMELESLMFRAKGAVQQAVEYIRKEVGQVALSDIEEKELNSLVSYVDKKAEQILVSALSQALPKAGFITEEDTVDQTDCPFIWIIDPLDGTTNFLHQIPYFSVSVALQGHGNLLLGIVHEVSRDECFSAVVGHGALLNGKPIFVTERKSTEEILVATGFPYRNDYPVDVHFKTLRHFLTNTRGIRRLGSAATDLCYVAAGRLGGYYESTLNAWDVAAGGLIVQEAGGSVTDFSRNDDWLFGGEILACPPQFQDEFIHCLRVFRKETLV